MFGLGLWEIVAIAIVILLLFRPEELPKLLRNLGRFSRQIKDLYRGASSAITDLSDEIKEPFTDTHDSKNRKSMWKSVSPGDGAPEKSNIDEKEI